MSSDDFRTSLLKYFGDLKSRVEDENGAWTVKGFIDVYKRIYTISIDTKVLSKVIELLMFPVIDRFAKENGFSLVLARAQNHYPDITLISIEDPSLIVAIDIKTTYRVAKATPESADVGGMTLGTFGGYFRQRDRVVSSTLPYNQYAYHFVLGIIYSRAEEIDERASYTIDELEEIPSVAREFEFFLQEKFRIASYLPGSGNTKNIGSTRFSERLKNGTGAFSELGIEVFDDYWMNYQTKAMARDEGFANPPYKDLVTYREHKLKGTAILAIPVESLTTITEQAPVESGDEDLVE